MPRVDIATFRLPENSLLKNEMSFSFHPLFPLFLLVATFFHGAQCIRFLGQSSDSSPKDRSDQSLKTAVFALGCFWRSEAVFGCLNGVVRSSVGYAGGTKTNPEYRSLGDHAESVQVRFSLALNYSLTVLEASVSSFID